MQKSFSQVFVREIEPGKYELSCANEGYHITSEDNLSPGFYDKLILKITDIEGVELPHVSVFSSGINSEDGDSDCNCDCNDCSDCRCDDCGDCRCDDCACDDCVCDDCACDDCNCD